MYTHILYLFTRPIQIQTLFWFSIHIRIYICVALVPLVSVYIISLILSVYTLFLSLSYVSISPSFQVANKAGPHYPN